MDVTACPRCASLDMRPPTIQDGMWPGGAETQTMVCHDCAYRGMPLLFDGADAYQAFRAEKETESGGTGTPEPTPRTEAVAPADEPRRTPQRATSLFIGALSLAIILTGLIIAGSNLSQFYGPAVMFVASMLTALAVLAVGVAFMGIAVRLWRGTPS